MSRRFLALGVACLIASSVGDNIRAPLLPLLARRYGVGYEEVSWFLVSAGGASFVFNLSSAALLRRLGERGFLLLAASLQTAAAAGVAAGGGYPLFIAWGALWGAGNSGLGLAANLFAIAGSDGPSRARSLGFLHLFYGVFSMAPAMFVAWSLGRGLGLAAMLSLPVLCGVGLAAFSLAGPATPHTPEAPRPGGALDRKAVLLCLATTFYVLGEVMTSMWLVSYLHGARGLALESASRWLAAFFVCLSAGRVALAWAGAPGHEERWCFGSLAASGALLAAGLAGPVWAFPAAAFAMGPVFPLMTARISLEYPDRYRSVLAAFYSIMTLGLAAGHGLVGKAAELYSISFAFALPIACLALSAAFLGSVRAEHRELPDERGVSSALDSGRFGV